MIIFLNNKVFKKSIGTVVVFVLYCVLPLNAQQDWELQKNEKDIKVYTRDISGSDFKEIKANTHFNHSLSEIVGLLTDMSAHKKWIYNCKESRQLKEISPTELYYYMELKVPWPVSNRDGVVCFKFSQDKETKVVTVSTQAFTGILPEIAGIVRVKKLLASWTFVPQPDGTIAAEYQVNTDPGGSVPAWIVNLFAVTGPYESITKMKKLLAENTYKDSHFDFITD